MRVDLRELQRVGEWRGEEIWPPEAVPLEGPDQAHLVAPLRVRVEGVVADKEALLTVKAESQVSMICGRCVERARFPLSATFTLTVPFEQEWAEVDEDVRQYVWLALPDRPLCRPQCRGLCAQCGRNLNRGPCGCRRESGTSPFEVLKHLIPKREKKDG